MEQNEIIASQPESASSLSTAATASATTSPSKVPSSPSTINKLNNNNSKSYTEIHFNAVNKAAGNGAPVNHPQRNERNDRNKSTAEETRRLLSPASASLQLSKKFVVMPTPTSSSPSASSTPSPPYAQVNSARNGANHTINNINNSSNNYLKPSSAVATATIPTTIVTTLIADSSSTDPSSTTSPIGTPSIAAGARPKYFQSMRSIRSGRIYFI